MPDTILLERRWLANVLAGKSFPVFADRSSEQVDALMQQAQDEGVVAQCHVRLKQSDAWERLPEKFRRNLDFLARELAVHALLRESECRRVLNALRVASIRPLVLKGTALAYWLYESPYLRDSVDIDLLFESRDQVERAVAVVQPLGFSLLWRNGPGDLVAQQLVCAKPTADGSNVYLDLHWRLCDSPVLDGRIAQDELRRDAIELPKLAAGAQGLSPVHACLHACMHRLSDQQFGFGDRLKWLYDLHLIVSRFDRSQWQCLHDLAIDRGLAGTCRDGLDASVEWFDTAFPADIRSQWVAAEARERIDVRRFKSWLYAQWINFGALPTWPLRLRWLRQRLLPDADYLRDHYGRDGRSLWRIAWDRLVQGRRRLRSR